MSNFIKQFHQFLEDNNAKEELLAAFAKQEPNTTLESMLTNLEERIQTNNYISSSILWRDTPSGILYWSDLDDKWRKLVKSLINQSN